MTASDPTPVLSSPARPPSRKGRADEKDLALGHKLRSLRKLQKLTLHEMARLFGISAQQVQKYETGEDRLSAVRLLELCKTFQYGLHQFTDDYIQSDQPALNPLAGMAEENLSYQATPPTLSSEEQKLLELYRRIDNADARNNVLKLIFNLAQKF